MRGYSIIDLRNKVVLVTGGAGFVGSHLVSTLVDSGASVVVLDLMKKSTKDTLVKKVKFVQADILEPLNIKMGNIDLIFHLAAVTDPVYCKQNPEITFKINVQGVSNILELAKSVGAKSFVYLSTAGVYGVSKYLPIDEEHPTYTVEPYAQSKLEGEERVLNIQHDRRMNVLVVRAFNIYGPGQNSNFVIPTIILQALKSRNIELDNPGGLRDYVYIRDIINGLIQVSLRGHDKEIYNLGSGIETSINDLVNSISKILGKELQNIFTCIKMICFL